VKCLFGCTPVTQNRETQNRNIKIAKKKIDVSRMWRMKNMWRKSSKSKLNSLRRYEATKLMAATTWEERNA
jgi:hypothetical protein